MSTLVVTGSKDGKPLRVVWRDGALIGPPDVLSELRIYASTREGDMGYLHPEGEDVPFGLDTYDSAWITVQGVFDSVETVGGDGPDEEMNDGDTTTEMADREYARWTPSAHPRWPKGTPKKGGKFMTKGEIAAAKKAGGPEALSARGKTPSSSAARRASAVTPAGAGPTRLKAGAPTRPLPIPKDPGSPDAIETDDVKVAAKLLVEGKAVRLKSTKQVSMLLDELAAIVKDAEARGEDAPKYNLCKVTVKDTNLFCVDTQGWPRDAMPQLKGIPTEGSTAHRRASDPNDKRLVFNDKGEVDITPEFLDHLRKAGYVTTDEEENAAFLKASQNELEGGKVAGMVQWMRGGGDPHKGGRMIISQDNYIVDGHHRWAATVGLDAEDGRLGNDKKIPVTRINIDIIKLLREAVLFANNQGIENAGWMASAPKKK